jgi:hypothetical protein
LFLCWSLIVYVSVLLKVPYILFCCWFCSLVDGFSCVRCNLFFTLLLIVFVIDQIFDCYKLYVNFWLQVVNVEWNTDKSMNFKTRKEFIFTTWEFFPHIFVKKFLYEINHFMKDKYNTFLIKIEWMYVCSLSDCIHNHLIYI